MTLLESEDVEGEDKFGEVDDVGCRQVLLLATIQEDSTGLQPIFVQDVVAQAHHAQCASSASRGRGGSACRPLTKSFMSLTKDGREKSIQEKNLKKRILQKKKI